MCLHKYTLARKRPSVVQRDQRAWQNMYSYIYVYTCTENAYSPEPIVVAYLPQVHGFTMAKRLKYDVPANDCFITSSRFNISNATVEQSPGNARRKFSTVFHLHRYLRSPSSYARRRWRRNWFASRTTHYFSRRYRTKYVCTYIRINVKIRCFKDPRAFHFY